MPGQGDTRGESTRTCSVTRCSCVGRKRGGKRGEGRAIPSAVSLWGTSPFADMRAEPPVGKRSPTHRRYEATAVAVLVGRAVEHRRRREGWRHAIGRQVDTVLRQRCREVQRGGAPTWVPVLRGGLEDARVLVEGEGLLPNFGSPEGAARLIRSQVRSIARVGRHIVVVAPRRTRRKRPQAVRQESGKEARHAGYEKDKLLSQGVGTEVREVQ